MHHWPLRPSVVAAFGVLALAGPPPALAGPVPAGHYVASELTPNDRLDLGEGVAAYFCVRNPDAVPRLSGRTRTL